MSWYCDLAPGHPHHGPYHDNEYGFPVADDRVLFERLTLEVMQAGLSWLTVLKKREAFSRAFAQFEIDAVAAFGEADRARLLADPGIIRNRLKIDATIHNARAILDIQDEFGSFAAWIARNHPRDLKAWIKLFRTRFRFVGGEIMNEFLMSIGYLEGAHRPDCPVFARIAAQDPAWMQKKRQGA
ncbi:3-methyl-adenine DNA glycosylase [uncultured Alphaproteobacteria bacterium]|uniref:3-methyl-adenine DNA glycosylase n=1 Tax=uncultured Alphaproteobacteria bacterium TaxID=91750 RepID=A0A212J8L9_9PROT|nr:3-methyl-adenine DNA glycosylase [uncultured Alphaproteobacteria bacterium]